MLIKTDCYKSCVRGTWFLAVNLQLHIRKKKEKKAATLQIRRGFSALQFTDEAIKLPRCFIIE